ncbi:MAG TPA: class I SAM-dependent methyltransferase, partial [Candidatus Limnocylindrales bacterium]|nr:class I SAM-dependent methyltransferase [Candidatus Limnocylindrales bacterium]
MLDRVRGFVWDLVCEGLFAHYRTSAGIAERHLGLASGAVVLDVGGGTGGVGDRLARDGVTVVVIEPSASLVAAGARRRRAARFVQGRGEALPVRDGAADAVLFIEVLHHVADGATALREAARVLRPGGRLLIEE